MSAGMGDLPRRQQGLTHQLLQELAYQRRGAQGPFGILR